jgi:hypothetical protein
VSNWGTFAFINGCSTDLKMAPLLYFMVISYSPRCCLAARL